MTAPPVLHLPILDSGHLARQSFGDRGLERDLLTLFRAQCERLIPRLADPDRPAAILAAHTLKGGAAAVGAARVAVLADALERTLAGPGTEAGASVLVQALAVAADEIRSAVAAHLRAA